MSGFVFSISLSTVLRSSGSGHSMFGMTLPFEHLTPNSSAFARFDPRWKLLATGIAIIEVSLLFSLPFLGGSFLASLLLVWLARVPRQWFWDRIAVLGLALVPFLVILPLTIDWGGPSLHWSIFSFSLDGLQVAGELALKTLSILILVLVLLGTTPFHQLALAAQRLRLPPIFVQLTLLSYRYVFVIADELHRLRIALRVRGFRNRAGAHSYRTIGRITGTLIVRGTERAERVAQAMRCRGFDGTFRALVDFRTTSRDVLFFALIVGFWGVLLVGEYLG